MERTTAEAVEAAGRRIRPRRGLAVTEDEYLRIALAEHGGHWELWDGRLVRKPDMTFAHNEISWKFGVSLYSQVDHAAFTCRTNAGHAHHSDRNYYVPDVMIIPIGYTLPLRSRQDLLEAYPDPLPLVLEVWSRSTGRYDVHEKLGRYRQPDGSYSETLFDGDTIQPVALAGVTIDLDALFDV